MKVVLFLVFFAALPSLFIIPYVGALLAIILIGGIWLGILLDLFR